MKIYIMTCNKYSGIVESCLFLLNKYFPNQDLIVFGNNKPLIALPQNACFVSLGEDNEDAWSNRIIKFLKFVGDEYFIFMLDDYFLNKDVDLAEVERRFGILRGDNQVGKIDLSQEVFKHSHLDEYKDTGLLIANNADAEYLMSFQPAMWRRNFFLRYLKSDESAWASEVGMSRRCMGDYEGKILGNDQHIMQYTNAVLKGKSQMDNIKLIDGWESIPGINNLKNINYDVSW